MCNDACVEYQPPYSIEIYQLESGDSQKRRNTKTATTKRRSTLTKRINSIKNKESRVKRIKATEMFHCATLVKISVVAAGLEVKRLTGKNCIYT